ncbi:amino acid ABC transporter substrate-binding protein [Treponema phagedenis]|uniref:ABC transporter, substrate-binding protein, family 3 n=1 Tax=Treponema phagedenis TaxID=162 RepID=A0A0B7H0C1_TREPH|nr:transporter substrate-binding domain-containing protein [Treponema phagedenis]NVP23193.1 transporter substrate-binding domain-containing protein [Treponema phagedenis]QEJ94814.1 transporter substrate-binding domain-containing protein [Treponema phagedenis]QEJ98000.1 transporter substrate-binding domain-containing protein [Treponema phagedenis]QEK00719.1 transporter substrate-binding domain-containing protein [Treponema phagedenis]QEK03507.1 transporter substrate-binding domain-containing pr
MKSKILLCIIAFQLLFLFFSCEKESEELVSDDISLSKVLASGKLIMGVDDDSPPMCFKYGESQIVGYDVDLARAVCRILGITLEIRPIPWSLKNTLLDIGEVDCIWSALSVTPEREDVFCFSGAYARTAQVIIVSNKSTYRKLNELKKKRMAFQASSSAESALAANPDFLLSLKDVIPMETTTDVFEAVINGSVDSGIVDLVTAHDAIRRLGMPLKILDMPLNSEVYAVGFKKGNIALMEAVQGALEKLEERGEAYNISQKWLGINLSIIGIE